MSARVLPSAFRATAPTPGSVQSTSARLGPASQSRLPGPRRVAPPIARRQASSCAGRATGWSGSGGSGFRPTHSQSWYWLGVRPASPSGFGASHSIRDSSNLDFADPHDRNRQPLAICAPRRAVRGEAGFVHGSSAPSCATLGEPRTRTPEHVPAPKPIPATTDIRQRLPRAPGSPKNAPGRTSRVFWKKLLLRARAPQTVRSRAVQKRVALARDCGYSPQPPMCSKIPPETHPAAPQEFFRKNSYCARERTESAPSHADSVPRHIRHEAHDFADLGCARSVPRLTARASSMRAAASSVPATMSLT